MTVIHIKSQVVHIISTIDIKSQLLDVSRKLLDIVANTAQSASYAAVCKLGHTLTTVNHIGLQVLLLIAVMNVKLQSLDVNGKAPNIGTSEAQSACCGDLQPA